MALKVQSFTAGSIRVNNYLVWDEKTKKAFLVDASENIQVIGQFIKEEGLSLEALLLTHAHFDHISGIKALLDLYPQIPLYQHESERIFFSDAKENLSAYTEQPLTVQLKEEPLYLKEGDSLNLLDKDWKVWHTAGHSPGSLVFLNEKENLGFSGDVIFIRGGIGRYDFPHSNETLLMASVKRLCTLPDDFQLYPGHGPVVSVGREKNLH